MEASGSSGGRTRSGSGGLEGDKEGQSQIRTPGTKRKREGELAAKAKQAWESTDTVFTNFKGGMVGYDKDHVKKIIHEMSKDSPHFKNEQRKLQQTEDRIQKMKEQARKLSQHELSGHTRKMDAKIAQLLASRDLSRTWIHVDLDAFYASVEELDDPSLKEKPMGVGGLGMLSTANYVARKYGIRSAMPGFIAKRLCPELVFVRPDFRKYTKASEAVRAIFREFDENLESGSLDEAYLDVTDYCAAHGVTGSEVAAEMRARVQQQTGLTCSCGVAPNSMLAKICSDMNKPNGQYVLQSDADGIRAFVAALSVRKVPGIGKVGQQELNGLGIATCGDLLEKRGLVSVLYSEVAVEGFLEAALGLGRTRHSSPLKEGEVGRKGMSVERTFAPISAPAELEAKCCELAGMLAEDLQAEGLKGKTLTLKLKPPTFEVKTRAVTLPAFISSEEEIRSSALRLLRAELPIQLRLMGLRMSNFHQVQVPPGQKSLAAFYKPKQPGGEEDCERDCGEENPGEPSSSLSKAGEDVRPAEGVDGPEGRSSPPKPEHKKGKKRTWACRLCTFEDNPWHLLRCLMCDERRGTAPRIIPDDQPPTADLTARQAEAGTEVDCVRQSGGEEAAAASQWTCPQCGASLDSAQMQEHRDYHLAVSLSTERQVLPTSRASARSSSRQRAAGGMPAITRFFAKDESKPNVKRK